MKLEDIYRPLFALAREQQSSDVRAIAENIVDLEPGRALHKINELRKKNRPLYDQVAEIVKLHSSLWAGVQGESLP